MYKYVTPHIESIDTLSPNQVYGNVKVFINGNIVGISDKPIKLYSILKNMKYDGIINIYTSIVLDYKAKELRVCNDSGNCFDRFYVFVKINLSLTVVIFKTLRKEIGLGDLLTSANISENKSLIEYIDPEEQSWSLIASNLRICLKAETPIKFSNLLTWKFIPAQYSAY